MYNNGQERARYTDATAAAAVYTDKRAAADCGAVDVLIYDDTRRRGRVINYTGWTTTTTTKKRKRKIKRVPARLMPLRGQSPRCPLFA